ncbi:Translin [Fistulina hepatica ATCC 64428]|uniref:Translin n=1 Tax=Fistulina hepatica ATCC 64428 TaxID=1128425 RepID=A0A0D7AE01_9AGAR|nr:Translin [Fistulina hepatica ATCC 64428]
MDSKDLETISSILDQDSELREKIKEQVNIFDKKTRTIASILNKIHSTPSDAVSPLLDAAKPHIASCAECTTAIAELVPPNQFWRWRDMWRNSLQATIFAVALVHYLEHGALIPLPQVEEILVATDVRSRFAIPPEDYLLGIINLSNELARLAVNAVTLGNFEQPIHISLFVKELFAGFSLLNLKNDILRRRFDSLKYDMKKIEDVVYDVSLRKLTPSSIDTAPPA